MNDMAGPVALVGSGEFLPVMAEVDAGLLRGRAPRAAIVPTAAAPEGDDRLQWWFALAQRHYEALGVEAVPVPVRTREEADDPDLARLVEGAGLVYLSGGDPHHLAATLRGSMVWDAVLAAWHGGAALAGCSAGAMALTAGAPADLTPGGRRADRAPTPVGVADAVTPRAAVPGLAVVGSLAVIPHFDLLERRRTDTVAWFASWQPPGTTLIGVEEDTAMVRTRSRWRVHGRGAVWVLGPGTRERFGAGDDVPVAGPGPPAPR